MQQVSRLLIVFPRSHNFNNLQSGRGQEFALGLRQTLLKPRACSSLRNPGSPYNNKNNNNNNNRVRKPHQMERMFGSKYQRAERVVLRVPHHSAWSLAPLLLEFARVF